MVDREWNQVSGLAVEAEQLANEASDWDAEELRLQLRTVARVTAAAAVGDDAIALDALRRLAVATAPLDADDDDPDAAYRLGVYDLLAAVTAEARRENQSREALATVARGSLPHRMLVLIDSHGDLASAEIERILGKPDSTVSRAGKRLADRGLVRKVSVKPTVWTITGRGQRALDAVGRHTAETGTRDVAAGVHRATLAKIKELLEMHYGSTDAGARGAVEVQIASVAESNSPRLQKAMAERVAAVLFEVERELASSSMSEFQLPTGVEASVPR